MKRRTRRSRPEAAPKDRDLTLALTTLRQQLATAAAQGLTIGQLAAIFDFCSRTHGVRLSDRESLLALECSDAWREALTRPDPVTLPLLILTSDGGELIRSLEKELLTNV